MPTNSLELLFELLLEQHPVGQAGQRIVMREIGNSLVGPPALGDILVGGNPASVGEQPVGNPDRAPVRGLKDDILAHHHMLHHSGTMFVDVSVERSDLLPMRNQIVQAAAPLCDLG